jgi:histidinol dehydrogenase
MRMRILNGLKCDQYVRALEQRGATDLAEVEPAVRRIVSNVRRNGDRALRSDSAKWDGLGKAEPLRVPEAELDEAWQMISPELQDAITQAAENIRRYCEWQKPQEWRREIHPGVYLGQLVRPLESVGCYVPGGRYPLVSTLLMTVIPAQVAGVKNIRVASPQPSPEVLGTAAVLGVRELYRVGGAQAIAALAYGTRSIERVDKIVGPGNAYVTVAKKLVSFDCAIDFLAGPTEAAVLSDAGVAEFIAADLVAQSEHDPDALAVFITTSRRLARSVAESAALLARGNSIAQESLRRRGAILVASSREQARDWANRLAAEHITVARQDLPFIHNAGSVFVGDYSAQAAGDYASGPNHVLPTSGQARFRGGLSVMDFVKIITVQQLSAAGLRGIAPAIECLARAEGLPAHAQSIRVRCEHA